MEITRSRLRGLPCLLLLVSLPLTGQIAVGEDGVAAASEQAAQSSENTSGAVSRDELAGAREENTRTFQEFVNQWMTPIKLKASEIYPLSEQYAYPHPNVPLKMEIVREEGEFVWLRGIPPENPESPLHVEWLKKQKEEALKVVASEFEDRIGVGHHISRSAVVVPPAERTTVRFRNVESGLPASGKWQMGHDIADMNSDGHVDLVLSPPRLGRVATPVILLGDGAGRFKVWEDVSWNSTVPFDYGDVEAADFDQDGYVDIVIAVHFKGQYILYGSPDGQFERFDRLPAPGASLTARGVAVDDFDGDGRPDVAFVAELDLDLADGTRVERETTVWTVLNTARGWKVHQEGLPVHLISDRIHAADVNADQRPDLVLGSNRMAWRLVVAENGLPDRWLPTDESAMMGSAIHPDVIPSDEANAQGFRPVIAVFKQSYTVGGIEGNKIEFTGIVKYIPNPTWSSADAEFVYFDRSQEDYYFRVATGDFNGDGLEDIAAARRGGSTPIEVWTQEEGGKYYLERLAGVESFGRAYDLLVHDLNGDGADDIVVTSSGGDDTPGGVRVWISEPAAGHQGKQQTGV
jgi:hypothetical protein